jgi:cell division cycle 14
MIVRGMTPE